MTTGIFRNPLGGLGLFGLGDVQQDLVTFCKNNCAANFPEKTAAQCASECAASWPKSTIDAYTNCATTCKAYRPDTPEWAQCIQNCHYKAGTSKYPAVSYDTEKAKCAAEGKEYSWLEGGCVDPKKFNGCPAGTMYATYPDGSEKCIGYTTDLTKTKCPAGTTLQKVPGGETCVSPVKPGTVKSTSRKTTSEVGPGAGPGSNIKGDSMKAGLFGIPTIGWVGIAAVIGVLGYAVYSKKQKEETGEGYIK